MLLSLLGHFLYTEWCTCTHWHATKSTRDNSCVLCVVVHFLNGTGLSSVGRINILNVCMFILILYLKCRKENPLWVIYRMIFITRRKKKKKSKGKESCASPEWKASFLATTHVCSLQPSSACMGILLATTILSKGEVDKKIARFSISIVLEDKRLILIIEIFLKMYLNNFYWKLIKHGHTTSREALPPQDVRLLLIDIQLCKSILFSSIDKNNKTNCKSKIHHRRKSVWRFLVKNTFYLSYNVKTIINSTFLHKNDQWNIILLKSKSKI